MTTRNSKEHELQEVIKANDMCETRKIIKKRGKGKNAQYYVKWLVYLNKFTSWVSASEIKKSEKRI